MTVLWLPDGALSAFYGLGDGDGLSVLIGNADIDAYASSHLAHQGLAKLAEAIGFDIKSLPKTAETLALDARIDTGT